MFKDPRAHGFLAPTSEPSRHTPRPLGFYQTRHLPGDVTPPAPSLLLHQAFVPAAEPPTPIFHRVPLLAPGTSGHAAQVQTPSSLGIRGRPWRGATWGWVVETIADPPSPPSHYPSIQRPGGSPSSGRNYSLPALLGSRGLPPSRPASRPPGWR